MMEKYGFVYLWFDKKHKRYYIGCRWGREDDGYVCSSAWMKQAYKHRPHDFKRRILTRVYTSRQDLLDEEYRWLSKIKTNELKIRYYNLHNHHFGHWSTNQNSKLTVSEKIKINNNKPKVKKKLREQKLGDKNPMKRAEVIAKRLESWKSKDHIPWNKGKKTGPKPAHSEFMKGRTPGNKGKKMDQEFRNKISQFNKERVWYVNLETNHCIHILKDTQPPQGYIRGRCKFKKKASLNGCT